MNQTTNYSLNQWEATDRVTRADFNADNTKIDAALKAVANAAGAAPKFAVGSYTGNGAATRTISVGFTPKAVFVVESRGHMADDCASLAQRFYYGGLAVTGSPVKTRGDDVLVEIAAGGFTVHYLANGNYYGWANTQNYTYHYVALG